MSVAISPRADVEMCTTFPLSAGQAEIWFAQKLDPESACYSMGRYVEIFGAVVPDLFAAAIKQAVCEIDGLRLGFVETELGPRQYFRRDADVVVPYFDLCGKDDPRATAIAWMREDMARVFDPTGGALFRYALFRIQHDRFFWYEVNHHLINDAFGSALVERRVAELYRGMTDGGAAPMETPPSLFDLLQADEEYRLSAHLNRDKLFWLAQLADRPDPLTLSCRMPRWSGDVIDSVGALPRAAAAALERAAKTCGATLAAAITAVVAVYLSRMTGARDVVLGMPVAARPTPKLRRVVGLASNVVPLRLTVDLASTFDDLLQQTGRRMREALRHQRYPASVLRQDFGLAPNEPDIYGTLMNFIPIDEDFDIAGCSIRKHYLGNWRVGDLLIAVQAGRQDADIQIELNANRANYDAQALDGHRQRLLRLLEIVAADPGSAIGRLQMLSGSERHLLRHWNATEAPYPRDRIFVSLFEEQAARTPDAAAISFEGAALRYGELNARANAVAHQLRALGVGAGVMVALCVPRSPALLAALLGVQKSGGAYVPLDPDYPSQRLEYMLADSGAKVLITAGHATDSLRLPDGVQTLDLNALAEAGRADNPTGAAGPQHTAYVIYTSGSTGRPKGVAVPHGALMNFLCSMQESPGLTAEDVLAAVTTVSFDIAALELYLPLMVGAHIELVSRATAVDGSALAQLLVASNASVLQATPSTWRMLLEAGWSGRPGFRALSGGEPLPRDLADALLTRVDKLWNLYGPTETTVWSTLDLVERNGAAISIGRPIANTQVHILDRAGEPAPIGVAGEICIGGAGVATGYLGRPGLTAERFIPDSLSGEPGARLYRTGDLGCWGVDGKLQHLGRLDHQVKIRGFRIELGEIESTLAAHPAVQEAAVLAREDTPGDKQLVAYFSSEQDISEATLRAHLESALPEYMVPSAYVRLSALPLTPNRKLDRRALPAPRDHAVGPRPYEAPEGPTETAIAAIWTELLHLERVGRRDDFFKLGGHSLTALRVIGQINNALRVHLQVATFFQSPTIERLANLVEQRHQSGHEPKVVQIQAGHTGLPLYIMGARPEEYQLAKLLGGDRAIYLIDVPMPAEWHRAIAANDRPALPTIEQLGALYGDVLLAHAGSAPCVIAGYSLGGNIAFEAAHALRRAGGNFKSILLVDAWAVTWRGATRGPVWQSLGWIRRGGATGKGDDDSYFNRLSELLANLWRLFLWLIARMPQMLKGRLHQLKHLFSPEKRPSGYLDKQGALIDQMAIDRLVRIAVRQWRPRPLEASGVLFRAHVPNDELLPGYDFTNGFSELFDQGIEVVHASGDHSSMVLAGNLLALARQINSVLARCDSDLSVGSDVGTEHPTAAYRAKCVDDHRSSSATCPA